MASPWCCRFVLGAGVPGVILAACSGSPGRPSTVESSAAAATTVRLELLAPSEIAPGESAQLTVNALKSDGRAENVTAQAQWTVQSFPTESVLAISPSGTATAGNAGRSSITARLGGFSANATVFVIPRGTFRLVGEVTDAAVGVANATVTVIAGVGQGLAATTSVDGEYELYGVAGAVQIRASKDGYADNIQQIEVAAHGSLAFQLTPSQPRPDFQGGYTLTIAGDNCSPPYPDQAKVRVYTADVTQTGPKLRVSLSGATFLASGSAFEGVVTPASDVQFNIRPVSIWDYDGPDIFERLSDGTQIIIGGVVAARGTPRGISGKAGSCCGSEGYMRLNGPVGECIIRAFDMVRR